MANISTVAPYAGVERQAHHGAARSFPPLLRRADGGAAAARRPRDRGDHPLARTRRPTSPALHARRSHAARLVAARRLPITPAHFDCVVPTTCRRGAIVLVCMSLITAYHFIGIVSASEYLGRCRVCISLRLPRRRAAPGKARSRSISPTLADREDAPALLIDTDIAGLARRLAQRPRQPHAAARALPRERARRGARDGAAAQERSSGSSSTGRRRPTRMSPR